MTVAALENIPKAASPRPGQPKMQQRKMLPAAEAQRRLKEPMTTHLRVDPEIGSDKSQADSDLQGKHLAGQRSEQAKDRQARGEAPPERIPRLTDQRPR
jgi:hypothetical protein